VRHHADGRDGRRHELPGVHGNHRDGHDRDGDDGLHGPEVTSFDVGDLSCDSGTTASVTVSWTCENATAVEIGVDSSSPAGYGPCGSTDAAVPCDGASHTITITPQSDAGPGAPQSGEVSPE
jgi:hypothetical protein